MNFQAAEMRAYHINRRDEDTNLYGVAGTLMATSNMQMQTFINGDSVVFAANQREKVNCRKAAREAALGREVRDLHDLTGALQAQPGMKQQTFVAGIVSKGNGDCFLTPDCHTALTAGGGQAGQGYPCIFAAGFSAGQGAEAGGIGYQTECAPTLKASESGSNMVPSVLCLNDQGAV